MEPGCHALPGAVPENTDEMWPASSPDSGRYGMVGSRS